MDRARFKARRELVKHVTVNDGDHDLTFRCVDAGEVARATTLLIKEERTVDWIRSEVRPGDVFCDIGANIGLYTLMAAKRVGEDGMVYAFEPHVANVEHLLQNIATNGLGDRVKVLSCALTAEPGYFDFSYLSDVPGTSLSQLQVGNGSDSPSFDPVFTELKFGTSIDALVGGGVMRPADLVKIDVDGHELGIIEGMRELLSSAQRPRAVQVEVDPATGDEIVSVMATSGYELTERHFTAAGRKRLAEGAKELDITHNAIFRPGGTAS